MNPSTPRVLIVEDDRDFAESLVLAMSVRQCAADVAHSGPDAIAMYQAGAYDLVFMDIKLPGKNGVETLTELREIDPQAKVVMMTGFSEAALLDTARQSGAMDVLRKPFKMRQLFSYLDALNDSGS